MGHGGSEKGANSFPRSDFGNESAPSGRKKAQKRSLKAPKPQEEGHPDRALGAIRGRLPLARYQPKQFYCHQLKPKSGTLRRGRKPWEKARNRAQICPSLI